MKIPFTKATRIQISPSYSIWDYVMSTTDVGISYQEIDGRVPEKGSMKNIDCWEAYFILEGTVETFIDDEKFIGEKGDVIEVLPGKKSYLVAKQAKIITITKPDWNEAQSVLVND